ncbi:MAG: bifunctional hydroxymethylpyrimidine kinase/phosphomethylpyrimidine kinase [Nitrospinota bacterium]
MKKVLTIAGSDSSGGAGIQGDLKTILSLGLFGTSAVTAVTAQSTLGVQSVSLLSAESVGQQIDAVLSDIGADAVKTGMLGNGDIVSMVCSKLKEHKAPSVVVDPVLFPKNGQALLNEDGVKRLVRELVPLATVVTPNIPEAEILSGRQIKSVSDMKKAAEAISPGGPAILIKGGHLEVEKKSAIDILWFGGRSYTFETERIDEQNTHGTGCVLSTALASSLARGEGVLDAVESAKRFVTDAIYGAMNLGKGQGPVNPASAAFRDGERYRVLLETEKAFDLLSKEEIGGLIPEIQSNLVVALEGAKGVDEVIGFAARIIKSGSGVASLGRPVFGGSTHIAHIVLTAMNFDPDMRSAMNLRYSPDIISACEKLRFSISSFNRKDEPRDVQLKEGSSLEWGVDAAIKKLGRVPDIIYDTGGDGKEPVTRVLGKGPQEVARKVVAIRNAL